MTPRDLTADLPAPRDDEPASLRNDIADELRDHLECALRREELKPPSEPWGAAPRSDAAIGAGVAGVERSSPPASAETASNYGTSNRTDPSGGRSSDQSSGGRSPDRATSAYQRVLQRFGDPRSVARKLWFDAMREKIMGQRLSLVLQGIMAAAVVALCLIVYQSLQTTAHTQGMLVSVLNKTQQELLQSQREANAQLIERLAALAKQSEAASGAPTEWNPLTVKVLLDTPDGKDRTPAADIFLTLRSSSQNTAGIPPIERRTDADGVADFGKVLYGTYELYCSAPNDMRRTELISVEPGKPREVTVICPQGDALTAVTPRIEPRAEDAPSSELADRLWYVVSLSRSSFDREWSRSPGAGRRGNRELIWVIGPEGQLLDASNLHWPELTVNDTGDGDAVPRSSLPPDPLNAFVDREMTLLSEVGTTPILAEPGNYSLNDIHVCLLSRDEQNSRQRLLFLQKPIRPDRTPPRSGWNSRSSQAWPPGRDQKPTFTVLYKQDGPVVIPLGDMELDRFIRVLAAAPNKVAWRFVGAGMNSVMFANFDTPQFAQFRLTGAEPTAAPALSGVEVIEWSAARYRRTAENFTERDPPTVTAIVLVTPAEREALSNAKRQLAISFSPDDSTRTELTPEIIETLKTPDPQPLPTY